MSELLNNWFIELLSNEKGLSPEQKFFEKLTAEIVLDPKINMDTLLELADVIGSTHKLQSEFAERTQHDFFYLIGDNNARLIIPAYNRVVDRFIKKDKQDEIVDLTDAKNRGLYKEFYPIFDRVVKNVLRFKLKK